MIYDGLFEPPSEDGNQYGPVAMMTFLVLTACITGLAIKGLALMLG